jgi:hypothetical protein
MAKSTWTLQISGFSYESQKIFGTTKTLLRAGCLTKLSNHLEYAKRNPMDSETKVETWHHPYSEVVAASWCGDVHQGRDWDNR